METMKGAKKVFDLKGSPVFVHFTFLILAAFFVFQGFGNTLEEHIAKLLWLPVLFVSITVHELGHAVAIRKYGYGRSKILLWGMGGLCINRRRYKPKDGLKIALAGPLFGMVLGAPFIPMLFFDLGHIINSLVWAMVFVNIGWSIVNLFPIFPLDGGRALYYGLREYTKKTADRAARLSGLIGLIVLVPIVLGAIMFQQLFIVFMALYIGHTAFQAWRYGHGALQL